MGGSKVLMWQFESLFLTLILVGTVLNNPYPSLLGRILILVSLAFGLQHTTVSKADEIIAFFG